MIRRTKQSGFTLIELMIVVAIIAIIAAIAIPRLMSARLSANEAAAISTLRSVTSAQAQLQSSAAIDTDADGAGEYGYFGELAGIARLRIYDPVDDAPSIGPSVLSTPLLPPAFGNVAASVVQRQGYNFQMWLPNATAAGLVPGIAEAATGGSSATFPNPNNGELLYCVYAWPADYNKTGNRCFFTNQEGDLLQCLNRSLTPYDGAVKTPGFSEAFTVAGDMGSALRIGTAGGADNTIWVPVN